MILDGCKFGHPVAIGNATYILARTCIWRTNPVNAIWILAGIKVATRHNAADQLGATLSVGGLAIVHGFTIRVSVHGTQIGSTFCFAHNSVNVAIHLIYDLFNPSPTLKSVVDDDTGRGDVKWSPIVGLISLTITTTAKSACMPTAHPKRGFGRPNKHFRVRFRSAVGNSSPIFRQSPF